jgi:hypothetical protein
MNTQNKITPDKFKQYLGEELMKFISSLNTEQLTRMKKNILQDIDICTCSKILFKREVELQYINYLLS